MLELLRKSGNPHYQIHDDFNTQEERCRVKDPEGYKVIFHDNDELEEDMEVMPNASTQKFNDEISKRTSTEVDSDDESDAQDSDDDDEEMRDEVEYITKDPVRQYQFEYLNQLIHLQGDPV